MGILKIFGHYQSKELMLRRSNYLEKKIKQSQRNINFFKDYSKFSKFNKLKFLIYDISKFNKKKVYQLLGLEHQDIKQLLIKLGLEFSVNFDSIPKILSDFYDLTKKYMFQYLIYLMFSKEYNYYHKFLIIAILKSKD